MKMNMMITMKTKQTNMKKVIMLAYSIDLDIQDILEETQMDLEIEYVRKLLRKNKGNIDQTIDYLLDNQQRILQ